MMISAIIDLALNNFYKEVKPGLWLKKLPGDLSVYIDVRNIENPKIYSYEFGHISYSHELLPEATAIKQLISAKASHSRSLLEF